MLEFGGSSFADSQEYLPPHLAVKIKRRKGVFDLDVNFTLTRNWTVLFGPSGSGKTTILRAIAGLGEPEMTRIEYIPKSIASHETMSESPTLFEDAAVGLFLPTHLRKVPLAPQGGRLFPHLSVTQNILYGTRGVRDRVEDGERDDYVAEMLARFRISHLAHKMPAALSGGEAQRVNLTRAVAASRKRWLLLDEPFTGLDVPLRDELIAELRSWQSACKTPILSVTHDVAEAFQLGAEVIKLAEGRVVDQGPVERVLAEERARLLAQLNGAAGSPA